MGEIEAPNKVLTKAEAEAAGLVCTGDSITLSGDSLTVSSDSPTVVQEEEKEIKVGKGSKTVAKKPVAKKK